MITMSLVFMDNLSQQIYFNVILVYIQLCTQEKGELRFVAARPNRTFSSFWSVKNLNMPN